MSTNCTVLHVDDEPDVLDLSSQLFERESAPVSMLTAQSGEEGLSVLEEHDVACLVSDSVRMSDGESFIEAASRETDAPIVLFTAKEWNEVATDAIAADVAEYVRKADTDDYKTVIRHVLAHAENAVDEDRRLIGQHDFASNSELGVSIVQAVARFVDRESTNFDPLYEAIDADALESMFAPSTRFTRSRDVEVRFSYEGVDLIVCGDGAIFVAR